MTWARSFLHVSLFILPLPGKDESENAGCSIVGTTTVWIAKERY